MGIDVDFARQVILAEAEAVSNLADAMDEAFVGACEAVLGCGGRVVTTGMGKAGIIAQKISATLSSTGTAALFMHPAEARHGDLGAVAAEDVVVALSNSGETEELIELLPPLSQIGVRVIAITGAGESTLASHAHFVLDIGRIEEPGELGLAPTASTTAMLAMGDAMALAVKKAKGFDDGHYSFYHGGGALSEKASGRRQLTEVRELMRTGERIAMAGRDIVVSEAMKLITGAHAGAVIVADEGKLVGIFTDGDMRRAFIEHGDIRQMKVGELMTSPCLSINGGDLVGEAQRIMDGRKINELPVVDDDGCVIGLLDVQDVVNARPFK